jgi:hypothetical protein
LRVAHRRPVAAHVDGIHHGQGASDSEGEAEKDADQGRPEGIHWAGVYRVAGGEATGGPPLPVAGDREAIEKKTGGGVVERDSLAGERQWPRRRQWGQILSAIIARRR